MIQRFTNKAIQPLIQPLTGGFTPRSLSPSLWLEADYGVQSALGRVSTWTDRNGIIATAPTEVAKPADDLVGGLPAITTTDARYLTIPKASSPLPGAGATVYWVGSTTSGLTVYGAWGLWATVTSGAVWLHALNDATNTSTAAYISESGTNTNRASKGAGDPSDGLTHANILRWTGSQVIASLDGASATAVACAAAKVPTADTQDFAIGRYQASLPNPAGNIVHRALIAIPTPLAAGSVEDLLMRAYLRRWGAP